MDHEGSSRESSINEGLDGGESRCLLCSHGPEALPRGKTAQSRAEAIMDRLTDRQRQVIQLMACGKAAHEIAEILWISEATVRHHQTRGGQDAVVPSPHGLGGVHRASGTRPRSPRRLRAGSSEGGLADPLVPRTSVQCLTRSQAPRAATSRTGVIATASVEAIRSPTRRLLCGLASPS